MIALVLIWGLFGICFYFVAVHYRDRAHILEMRVDAHRTAAAKFLLEVRKLERRARYLERKRMWLTRRAWARRSGYRALGMGRWRVLP